MDDVRQALRGLWRQRGFAAVAILTLAFGIGVNVSLFGLISAFLFQPLPIPNPHQLVLVMQRSELLNVPHGLSYADYRDIRAAAGTLSPLAAYMPAAGHLAPRGQVPERTWLEIVSPEYFAIAGVAPALGKFPSPGVDEAPGAPASIVLSYRYWQRRFGGNPSAVGQTIAINGRPFTVSGVAPESFTGLSWAMAVSGWVPSGAAGSVMDNGAAMLEKRDASAWRLMGRLRPGATVADARAEIELLASRLASAYPAEHKGTRLQVMAEMRSRPDPTIAGFLPVFAVLFALMGGLVLLIACANVANLMLARAVTRQRDLAIRSALGATRGRLMRLQIVESLLIAAAAGAVGVLLAQWSGQVLAGFTPTGDIPVNDQRPQDWRVYVFTFLVSAAAGIVTALWPARRATRFDVVESLKDGSAAAGTVRHRLRDVLVVGQVTMSLVVLASGGLFLHSLERMRNLEVGLQPDGLLLASIDLGLQRYDEVRGRRLLDDVLERVEALPAVTGATVMTHVPFDYGITLRDVAIEGPIPGSKDDKLSCGYSAVGATFFETVQLPLTLGRALDASDDERARPVAVVNETMARRLWPGADAIGRRFRFESNGPWIEVVGVARDGKYLMLVEPQRPYFYVPLAQHYKSPVTFVVRSATDPAQLGVPLQRAIDGVDSELPVYNVRTMRDHMRDSVFAFMPFRIAVVMSGTQGAVGLLLAVMGLYAIVAYTVARRTREIGVRMALGAARADVVGLVVRGGLKLSLIGIGIGLLLSLALGFVLSHVLYGLRPVDVPVLGGVTSLLLAVAAIACYLPARRATRVDPIIVLRCE